MLKLKELLFGKSDCGCSNTEGTVLKEQVKISENLQYHLDNKIPLGESIFRISSNAHVRLFLEVRKLWEKDQIQLSEAYEYYMYTDAGKQGVFDGKLVPLDLSYLLEVSKKKKQPPLNKPKRGGPKAYYVYVRDPKTKKIKKVTFGSGGLKAKLGNKEASQAFAKRHDCKNKKDRTKAS